MSPTSHEDMVILKGQKSPTLLTQKLLSLEDDSFEITGRNKITKKEFLQLHGQHAIERRRKEKRKKVNFLEGQHAD